MVSWKFKRGGRLLDSGAGAGFLSQRITYELAENPDLQEFVQDLVGQQGVGLATSTDGQRPFCGANSG